MYVPIHFSFRIHSQSYFQREKTLAGFSDGNPLQYSCLENPRDRGAWWAAVYGVAKSRTWLKQLSSSSSDGLSIRGEEWRKSGIISRFQVWVITKMWYIYRDRESWKGNRWGEMGTDGSVGFRHIEIEVMGNTQMEMLCRQLEMQSWSMGKGEGWICIFGNKLYLSLLRYVRVGKY